MILFLGGRSEFLKQRNYISLTTNSKSNLRLSQIGEKLFTEIYPKPINFPFDGFGTSKGNAADTCYELTYELIQGKIDWNVVISKPPKTKNRAIRVLRDSWGVFNKDGSITRRPSNAVINELSQRWDDAIRQDKKIALGSAFRNILKPPYGGNIASTGLFLATFIAARFKELIILENGKQLNLFEWVQAGIFKGKYINLLSLDKVEIHKLDESAYSEWEELLDEWENQSLYQLQIIALNKYYILNKRIPLPAHFNYRVQMLIKRASEAQEELAAMDSCIDEAWQLIDRADQTQDSGRAAKGAAKLKTLLDKMKSESGKWQNAQIATVENSYSDARQKAQQYFPSWLVKQVPGGDSAVVIGDFKHKMLFSIGNNFKKIGFDSEYEKIEEHTLSVTRKAESIIKAKHLVNAVDSLIKQHENTITISRLFELRSLKEIVSNYVSQLQSFKTELKLPEVNKALENLVVFSKTLSNTEASLINRFREIMNEEIKTDEDIPDLLTKVNSLIIAFEGIPDDLEDLKLMQELLNVYKSWASRLNDDWLNWNQFHDLVLIIRKEAEDNYKEVEIPWRPTDVVERFIVLSTTRRNLKSQQWLEMMKKQSVSVNTMTISEASNLYTQLNTQPVYLTQSDTDALNTLIEEVDKRLGALKVEVLLQQLMELPDDLKKSFIVAVKQRLIDLF